MRQSQRISSLRFLLLPLFIGATIVGCSPENSASTQGTVDPADAGTVADVTSAEAGAESVMRTTEGFAGMGFIQIGDVRHELTVQRCLSMFGALSANAVSVTEPDNLSAHFEFAPADWRQRDASEGWEEAGTITVRSDDPYNQWESGLSAVSGYNLGDLDAKSIDITSLEITPGGRGARGEARFVEMRALMGGNAVPTTGLFEFNCPPK